MAKHDNKKYIIVDVIYWKQKTHNFLDIKSRLDKTANLFNVKYSKYVKFLSGSRAPHGPEKTGEICRFVCFNGFKISEHENLSHLTFKPGARVYTKPVLVETIHAHVADEIFSL